MKTILFSLPGNEKLTELMATKMDAEVGKATLRNFPDGESYTRILSDVKDKCVVLVCTLHEPRRKTIAPLFFKSYSQIIRGNVHLFGSALFGIYEAGQSI
ncbi:ribose-phosphate pyrophosphokinase-like domain-containing protein [Lacinutrix neustonica]|uniref:Ribose-phosphate pyrophosphokinase-like domain-containing protein n=1 Tax=Lacinutrix neustonica TaxID=2980107 RepID=A0A9E8MWK3_9FLAO|nr:ribose-phosphate pyrophosphokinase-like domain-containing protein [Lacinutrix neustonica]WAC01605.1 ribose-phosphate pyrophosphokinase-like domain-containing protein [Lacinutrix neustonica]